MIEFLLESGRASLPAWEIGFRLALAALLGAVIGFDREVRDRPAGLRTHMLIALAAATFTLLTLELFEEVKQEAGRVTADPIRIIEAVTAGVAFLAAGAIIQSRGRVKGLTTGAAMWLAGALGLASGAGYYRIGLTTLALALIILTALKFLEARWLGSAAASQRDDE